MLFVTLAGCGSPPPPTGGPPSDDGSSSILAATAAAAFTGQAAAAYLYFVELASERFEDEMLTNSAEIARLVGSVFGESQGNVVQLHFDRIARALQKVALAVRAGNHGEVETRLAELRTLGGEISHFMQGNNAYLRMEIVASLIDSALGEVVTGYSNLEKGEISASVTAFRQAIWWESELAAYFSLGASIKYPERYRPRADAPGPDAAGVRAANCVYRRTLEQAARASRLGGNAAAGDEFESALKASPSGSGELEVARPAPDCISVAISGGKSTPVGVQGGTQ